MRALASPAGLVAVLLLAGCAGGTIPIAQNHSSVGPGLFAFHHGKQFVGANAADPSPAAAVASANGGHVAATAANFPGAAPASGAHATSAGHASGGGAAGGHG